MHGPDFGGEVTTPPDTTTTTTNTGGGTTTTTSDLCEVTPVVADDAQLSVSGAFTKTSGRYTVRPNEFAKFECNAPAGGTGIVTIFSEILNCGAEGVFDNALPECVAEAGGGTTTNCTFAAIANSDHASTLTYNIGDEWTYTCLSGFHLDDGGDSRVVQSIGYLCTEEAAKLDFLPTSSCVENEVNCMEEYASCLNPTEEIPHAETTRCIAEVRQVGEIFFLDSGPDRRFIGQDLSVAQYCGRFGSMARHAEAEACQDQRIICEGT